MSRDESESFLTLQSNKDCYTIDSLAVKMEYDTPPSLKHQETDRRYLMTGHSKFVRRGQTKRGKLGASWREVLSISLITSVLIIRSLLSLSDLVYNMKIGNMEISLMQSRDESESFLTLQSNKDCYTIDSLAVKMEYDTPPSLKHSWLLSKT